ncbi:hypothetical protein HDU67_008369 [Dinochytrium kinnereticum]|nr:hypothetical protein HDU67_008369 [Dinochytrium kinnereticum]
MAFGELSRTFMMVDALPVQLERRLDEGSANASTASCVPAQGYYCCPGATQQCPLTYTCTTPYCTKPPTQNDNQVLLALVASFLILTFLFAICIFATRKSPSHHTHRNAFDVDDLEVTGRVLPGAGFVAPKGLTKGVRTGSLSSGWSGSSRSSVFSVGSFGSLMGGKRLSGGGRPVNGGSPLAFEWKEEKVCKPDPVAVPVSMERTGFRHSGGTLPMPPCIEPQFLVAGASLDDKRVDGGLMRPEMCYVVPPPSLRTVEVGKMDDGIDEDVPPCLPLKDA